MGASEPPEDCGAVDACEGGHCFRMEIEPGHEPIEMLGAGVDGGLGFQFDFSCCWVVGGGRSPP